MVTFTEMQEMYGDIQNMKVALENKVNAFNTYYAKILTKKYNNDNTEEKEEEVKERVVPEPSDNKGGIKKGNGKKPNSKGSKRKGSTRK